MQNNVDRQPVIHAVTKGFTEEFGAGAPEYFSAPGRTEIGGNHTDHQHGNVLAAAVSLETVGAAAPNGTNMVRIHTEGHMTDVVDITSTAFVRDEVGTSPSLIRGVAAYLKNNGFTVRGFDAYTINGIPRGSGLSSSAAYEVLIGTIFNHLFNGGGVSPLTVALAGKYAENEYYGKPCGLMDQLTSALGGVVAIDFEDPVNASVTDGFYDFKTSGHKICIIETGGNHNNLTDEYAAIPSEMAQVASLFHKEVLRDVPEDSFYRDISKVRDICGDRATLRALHFFDDNKRVLGQVEELRRGDFTKFLNLVNESGRSSWMYLQNIYPKGAVSQQPAALALALADKLLRGRGASRIHGGGFAGTIQAFVPDDMVSDFKIGIEKLTGSGTCRVLDIRNSGGIKINL